MLRHQDLDLANSLRFGALLTLAGVHAAWAGLALVVGCVGVGLLPAAAAVIDFESLPGGAATTDGQLITTEYESAFGISFELLDAPGVGPRIAKVGLPQTAFQGPLNGRPECGIAAPDRADMPQVGAAVGCSFLTDDGALDNQSFKLRVTFTAPVTDAGGILVDVDGPERWTLTFRREDESVVDAIEVLPPGGDGAVSPWSFTGLDPVKMIDFVQTGSTSGVGLAFDNISFSTNTTATPELAGKRGGSRDGTARAEPVSSVDAVLPDC